MISLEELLKARSLYLEAERRRERVMRVRLGFPFGLGRTPAATAEGPPAPNQ